jgi:MaoC dehydratase-like protein
MTTPSATAGSNGRATDPAAAQAVVPRELRGLVGAVGTPRTIEVGAESVRRFLLATAPRAWRAHPSGTSAGREADAAPGSVVPPTVFCPDPIVAAEAMGLLRPRPLARTIDGGTEWKLRHPVRVGDTLTQVARIAGISARRTADGRPMILTVLEVEVWNQHGVSVGVARGTSLSYEDRPP